ncbi:hypothetical protein N9L68_05245 [bacterium]|nr:hypothetical protein [bacterium]
MYSAALTSQCPTRSSPTSEKSCSLTPSKSLTKQEHKSALVRAMKVSMSGNSMVLNLWLQGLDVVPLAPRSPDYRGQFPPQPSEEGGQVPPRRVSGGKRHAGAPRAVSSSSHSLSTSA